MNNTLQVRFKIHEIEGLPEKYSSDTFCAYNWVDEAGDRFETPRLQKDRNPKYNYEHNHDLFVSSYLAENLQYSILMIGVYGKLSEEKMHDLAIRPHTQALLKDQFDNSKNEPFYEDKGENQDIFKLNESGTRDENKFRTMEDPEKRVKELEKKLKKLLNENEKLKKTSGTGKKDSSCCIIF